MPDQIPANSSDEFASALGKRVRKLSIGLYALSAFLVLSMSTLSFFLIRRAKSIERAQEDLRFFESAGYYEATTDFVVPEVNTIQFLRRGYSIDFDSVQYNQNGLVLSGTVGNATQLWVSSLALNFSARPYPHQIRDKWKSAESPWWNDDWSFGKGQATVGYLNPGSSASFQVTIPNVKQTSDNIQIAVWFSGERYQYLGK